MGASIRRTLLFALTLSLLIDLLVLALPYSLVTYADQAPISLGEIAQRRPLPAVAFLLGFAALFWLYSLAYRACRRAPEHAPVPLIFLGGLALALVLAAVYPIGAGDVVDYVTHGEELVYFGGNPLVTPPGDFPDAVFARYSAYRHVPCNYGPLWIWISGLVVGMLGRRSLVLNLLGFKAVAIGAYLGQAAIIYAFLRRRDPARAPAGLLFFAWNPLVLYEFAANGHNDGTMTLFLLLALLLWERERPLWGILALTLSFLVKIPASLIFPLYLAAAIRRQGVRMGVAGLLMTVGLVAEAYLSLPQPLDALTNLSGRSGLFTHSLPALVRSGLMAAGVASETASKVTNLLALGALGAWYLPRLWRTWRAPSYLFRATYEVLLFLLLFATPWFQPWYVTWVVALAALFPRPDGPIQAGLLSLTVVVSYVVYGFLWFWIPDIGNWEYGLGINLIAVGTTFLVPWTYWLLSLRHQRRRERTTEAQRTQSFSGA